MKSLPVSNGLSLLAALLCCLPAWCATGEKAWLFEQKHQIFGPCNNYVSKAFFRGDNLREGTVFVHRLDEPHFYCFNKAKKVYYRGDGKSAAKRISLMAIMDKNSGEGLNWSNAKWRLVGKEKVAGMITNKYVFKGGKTWMVWVAELPGVDRSIYKDFLEWISAPYIGGMPVRIVVATNSKNRVTTLDTTVIKTVVIDSATMTIPKGSRRIDNLFQLSSNRTEQLMESFSEILGD